MATQIIPPFPDDIDRIAFGHWLSGFCDGESSFVVRSAFDRRPGRSQQWEIFQSYIRITLRDDDSRILRDIQSYWQCGTLHAAKAHPSIRNAKPTTIYNVSAIPVLASTIIPHFDRFPLRSKKARDYAIWKQCVRTMQEIQQRTHVGHGGVERGKPGIGWNGKWKDEDNIKMRDLVSLLKKQRQYESP